MKKKKQQQPKDLFTKEDLFSTFYLKKDMY